MVRDLPNFSLPDLTSWRVRRQRDEEHRIRKEEKEAAKRIKKDKERQARDRDARAMPGSPYGAAYSNPMNDLERRMDGVDLSRGRGATVGDYNSKRRVTHVLGPPLLTLVLSRRSPVRITISNPDRASIAQHGCDKSRIFVCPRRVSEQSLSVSRAWR